jgi:hypothetical protein
MPEEMTMKGRLGEIGTSLMIEEAEVDDAEIGAIVTQHSEVEIRSAGEAQLLRPRRRNQPQT